MENFFAKNLKKLREQKNMSQEELASKLGVELATISHWENKRREPKMDMVVKIATLFNINDEILFKDLSKTNIEEYPNKINIYTDEETGLTVALNPKDKAWEKYTKEEKEQYIAKTMDRLYEYKRNIKNDQ